MPTSKQHKIDDRVTFREWPGPRNHHPITDSTRCGRATRVTQTTTETEETTCVRCLTLLGMDGSYWKGTPGMGFTLAPMDGYRAEVKNLHTKEMTAPEWWVMRLWDTDGQLLQYVEGFHTSNDAKASARRWIDSRRAWIAMNL